MHSSLVALLKKKYVYEDTLWELKDKFNLTDKDIEEFHEVYSGNVRSFESNDQNNFKIFLQDICKYPPLSSEEEQNLLKLAIK